MEKPIVVFEQCSYRYPHAGAARPALDCACLEVRRGELVAVVGANGSGKSTLARMINGLLLPDSGEVRVLGMSTRDRERIDAIRETVGMVFQNPESQIVANSVEDDIAFGLENIGLPVPEIEERIEEALAAFGLEELRDREPHWLSGGQKQRTVLAGVMALRPEALVLDEPTSMLDPLSQREFLAYIGKLRLAGTTIIYITHIMQEAAAADRVVVLGEGRVVADAAPREIFSDEGLLRSAGLTAPLPVRLSRALGAPAALTLEELLV